MQRKLFLVLVLTALVPVVLFASGKIRGKVTDLGTGEPLVGANVVVVGSSMGAATNVAGEFIILNVPAGTYQLKTSYVGYQTVTISNIRVNNDLTTEQLFQLPSEGVTVGTVEIVAERPMINKSATNSVRIIDNEFFSKIPARGTNTAIAIQPGVVVQGGNVYIRGGRPDEVGFKMEGVGINNIVFGGQALNITAEAVEQIQVQAGGFQAEYGGANAGIVQTQLRSGSPEGWKGSILAETDNWTKQNKSALGGYSYGYSDYTATLGGPLFNKKLRVFASVQNTFYRDPAVSVREAYDFSGANALVTDLGFTPGHRATAAHDTINVSAGGNFVGGQNNQFVYTGSLVLDLGQVQLRGSGSYSKTQSRNTTIFANIFNQARLPLNLNQDGFANLKLSHVLSPTTFYEVNFNYYANVAESRDPDFGQNLLLYGDSVANARLGYQLKGNSLNYSPYSLFNGAFTTNQYGTQISGYNKTKQRSLGGRLDLTTQMKQHEIKVGGEYTQYTIRRYAPSGVFSWAQIALDNPAGATRDALFKKIGGTGSDIYGYDINGNEIGSDIITNNALSDLGPRKPTFAAAYIQDKIEFSDIILNLGLRYDYINPDSKDAVNPGDIRFNADELILASSLTTTEKTSTISPRIGFSFPVTDRTVFHAQYGRFVQQTRLRDSYLGIASVAGIVKGGFFVTTPNGWGLKPTKTTQYEMGFSQQLSDVASFDITAFYKDIQDQIQYTNIIPVAGAETGNYASLVNADFATSKGVEFKFILRRTNRISAQLNYTFADTRTTGSNSASTAGLWSAGSIVAYPKYVFPADFDQPHRGSMLLDYRFAKGDGGPVLSQLGLNLLLQFNSGHAFTRLDAGQRGPAPTDPRFRIPIEAIGSSSTPWYFQLDARLDKVIPIGPFDFDLYVYVINLLGTDNAVNAFFRNGDPKNDGWFATAAGQEDAKTLGPQYVSFYNAVNLGQNSGNFGPPRQIRFGVKLDF
jgi:outer membrane receptor for ferrienterochelin and colicin